MTSLPTPGNQHQPPDTKPPQYFWLWVMCLLGVDYFSTLAYQPSITYQLAGRLGPLATVVVVLVTLAGALPIYWYVAGQSPHGQGSIALLERLVHGWRGKSLVLLLLGFAATDFIMVKTISLADAAVHVIGNDHALWHRTLDSLEGWSKQAGGELIGPDITAYFDKQLVVTLLLLALGFIFWFMLRRGFTRNVMALAVPLVILYLILNAVIIGSGLLLLARRPEIVSDWFEPVSSGNWHLPPGSWFSSGSAFLGGWGMIALLCFLFFPRLSLGLSGFELSLILMPQIRGRPQDDPHQPRGRIVNTRKVLVAAALVMSIFLIGSVLVTNLLIPEQQLLEGGQASNRALAYLAHGGELVGDGETLNPLFGRLFGTIYDLITVLLLCLAGTSVMTALAFLLPQFLLRFGMQLHWMRRWGLLLILFALVNLALTLWFRASVTDQRGAYATAVLVLFTSASFATVMHKTRPTGQRRTTLLSRLARWSGLIALWFLGSAIAVMAHAAHRPVHRRLFHCCPVHAVGHFAGLANQRAAHGQLRVQGRTLKVSLGQPAPGRFSGTGSSPPRPARARSQRRADSAGSSTRPGGGRGLSRSRCGRSEQFHAELADRSVSGRGTPFRNQGDEVRFGGPRRCRGCVGDVEGKQAAGTALRLDGYALDDGELELFSLRGRQRALESPGIDPACRAGLPTAAAGDYRLRACLKSQLYAAAREK